MWKGVNKVALRLFEYNEKAYHAAVRMMEQYGKAAIVHPTGKCESYIASEMTLGEAVVRGVLPDPKYVTAAGERLEQWVASQQWAYPKGKLTDEQVERLNRIGMYWGNRNDRQWNEGYQEAKRYFDAHGDLNVPAGYVSPDGYNLGNWVKRQRYTRHNPEKSCAVLTEERIAKLDEIGMRWEKADSRTQRLELAQEPKRKSESLNVLADHKTGEGIGLCSRSFDPE